MTKTRQIAGLGLALLLLAGCGQSGSLPTTPSDSNYRSRLQDQTPAYNQPGMQPGYGQQPGAVPGMNPAMGGPGAAEGNQLLQRMRQTFAACRGFEADIRTYSEGHYKTGQRVSELRNSTTRAKITWAKPNKLRAEVEETTNSLLVGAAMATTDGENITARCKGLLGLIPFHLTASDAKMSSNRNHAFTTTNPNSQLTRITAASVGWTVIGDNTVQGTPVKVIELQNVQHLDSEVTRELVMIDPQTMGLRGLVEYVGTHKVEEMTFLSFRWNPSLSASLFNL